MKSSRDLISDRNHSWLFGLSLPASSSPFVHRHCFCTHTIHLNRNRQTLLFRCCFKFTAQVDVVNLSGEQAKNSYDERVTLLAVEPLGMLQPASFLFVCLCSYDIFPFNGRISASLNCVASLCIALVLINAHQSCKSLCLCIKVLQLDISISIYFGSSVTFCHGVANSCTGMIFSRKFIGTKFI